MPPDPTPPRRRLWDAWSPLQLASFGLMLLVAQMFWQFIIYGWTGDVFIPVIAAALIAVVLPMAAVARKHGEGLLATYDLWPDRRPLLLGAAAGLLAVAPAGKLAGISARLRPPSPDYLAFLADQLPQGAVDMLVAIVAVSLAAPLAEELVFRGLFFRLSRRRWGPYRAAILTGLFFGIAHWQPWSLFGLVALGILLALLYHWTGSLMAPLAAHAAHNMVSLIMLIRTRDDLAARASADLGEAVIEDSGGLLADPGGWLLALASSVLLWRLLRFLHRHAASGNGFGS
jgi:membrane protease YdiL (CAAX protease family)